MIEAFSPATLWVLQAHLLASLGTGFCAYHKSTIGNDGPELGPISEISLRVALISGIVIYWASVIMLVVVSAPIISFLAGVLLFFAALESRRIWSLMYLDHLVIACIAMLVQGSILTALVYFPVLSAIN